MTFCTQCGHNNSASASSCEKCGAATGSPAEISSAHWACHFCNALTTADSNSCWNCHKLRDASTAANPNSKMLLAVGNIQNKYEVVGVVFGYSLRAGEGCSNSISLVSVFKDSVTRLEESAADLGADGVIHINFQQRDTIAKGCGGGKPASEVYAWGTAIKFVRD